MTRPLRVSLSPVNLSRKGIPKKFHDISITDYQDYGNDELTRVRDFIIEYLDKINSKFESNAGLLFYGSNGVGKSMLASIIIKEAYRNRYSSKRVTFIEYINEYTRMWGEKGKNREELEELFYHDFKAVEFLVLEELGKEIDTKIASPILEDCLRYREDYGLVTIICSNLTPKMLFEKYGPSISSLLKGNCTPVKIESVDQRNSFYKERTD